MSKKEEKDLHVYLGAINMQTINGNQLMIVCILITIDMNKLFENTDLKCLIYCITLSEFVVLSFNN